MYAKMVDHSYLVCLCMCPSLVSSNLSDLSLRKIHVFNTGLIMTIPHADLSVRPRPILADLWSFGDSNLIDIVMLV